MPTARVLIIDDDPIASDLLRRCLQRRTPFHVREEVDLTCAVSTARAYRPDIILLDVDRPWKDDCDVLRELKFDPVLRGVPVIRMSVLDAEEDAALRAGAPFLAKPIDQDHMVQLIFRTLMEDGQICALA